MKFIFSILTLVGAAQASAASGSATENYKCVDQDGHTASLSVKGYQLAWDESWHAASSRGEYVGIESSPYAKTSGFYKYRLIDFYMTNDSTYYLALRVDGYARVTVVTYFDNDGHTEETNSFTCRLQ